MEMTLSVGREEGGRTWESCKQTSYQHTLSTPKDIRCSHLKWFLYTYVNTCQSGNGPMTPTGREQILYKYSS